MNHPHATLLWALVVSVNLLLAVGEVAAPLLQAPWVVLDLLEVESPPSAPWVVRVLMVVLVRPEVASPLQTPWAVLGLMVASLPPAPWVVWVLLVAPVRQEVASHLQLRRQVGGGDPFLPPSCPAASAQKWRGK